MEKHSINKAFEVELIEYKNQYDFSQIHRHTYFELILFQEGEGQGTNRIDFEEYTIHKNSLHIVCPDQIHLMKRRPGDTGLIIQFTKEFLVSSIHQLEPKWMYSLQSNPMAVLEPEQFAQLYASCQELNRMTREQKVFGALKVQHYFAYIIFQILEILSNHSVKASDNITLNFLMFAEAQFRENRTVESYAEQMHISTRKLRDKVRESLGRTPIQVLHELTMLEIKRLLSLKNISQKEIAHTLHFDSAASYTRFVKKYFDCSPTELALQF